jgi:hypothetical protein
MTYDQMIQHPNFSSAKSNFEKIIDSAIKEWHSQRQPFFGTKECKPSNFALFLLVEKMMLENDPAVDEPKGMVNLICNNYIHQHVEL